MAHTTARRALRHVLVLEAVERHVTDLVAGVTCTIFAANKSSTTTATTRSVESASTLIAILLVPGLVPAGGVVAATVTAVAVTVVTVTAHPVRFLMVDGVGDLQLLLAVDEVDHDFFERDVALDT